jgi:hypothetical protein
MDGTKSYPSKFDSLQRVRRSQVDWILENKKKIGGKTVAGCLDIIINEYKKKIK